MSLFLAEGFAAFTLDELAARLGCSKRTLYALADSKEQLATSAVKLFFRRATDHVESQIRPLRSPAHRLTRYLEAVAETLAPASRVFLADVLEVAPTRELYRANTAAAAGRVRELIDEGRHAGVFRHTHDDFIAEVVTATMERIGTGQVHANTGLNDAEAYAELAKLVLASVSR